VVDLSSSPFKEILVTLITATLAVTAYFAVRKIERKNSIETIDRQTKLITLHKTLKAEGLSVKDLEMLEQDITNRRRGIQKIEDQVAADVHKARLDGPLPGQSQSEMNYLAAADLRIADAMLEKALAEAEMHCQPDEVEPLHAAQVAWTTFAQAEAAYRSLFCKGGSMYRTVYPSELERLTISRIAELKAHVEWQKELL
jgi:uncharacterized protein YecT (DUF1311 family)